MVENVLLENDNKRGCRNCGAIGIGNGIGIILVAIVVAVSRQGTLAAFAGVGVVVGVFVAA
jgi:hypothetical protein